VIVGVNRVVENFRSRIIADRRTHGSIRVCGRLSPA